MDEMAACTTAACMFCPSRVPLPSTDSSQLCGDSVPPCADAESGTGREGGAQPAAAAALDVNVGSGEDPKPDAKPRAGAAPEIPAPAAAPVAALALPAATHMAAAAAVDAAWVCCCCWCRSERSAASWPVTDLVLCATLLGDCLKAEPRLPRLPMLPSEHPAELSAIVACAGVNLAAGYPPPIVGGGGMTIFNFLCAEPGVHTGGSSAMPAPVGMSAAAAAARSTASRCVGSIPSPLGVVKTSANPLDSPSGVLTLAPAASAAADIASLKKPSRPPLESSWESPGPGSGLPNAWVALCTTRPLALARCFWLPGPGPPGWLLGLEPAPAPSAPRFARLGMRTLGATPPETLAAGRFLPAAASPEPGRSAPALDRSSLLAAMVSSDGGRGQSFSSNATGICQPDQSSSRAHRMRRQAAPLGTSLLARTRMGPDTPEPRKSSPSSLKMPNSSLNDLHLLDPKAATWLEASSSEMNRFRASFHLESSEGSGSAPAAVFVPSWPWPCPEEGRGASSSSLPAPFCGCVRPCFPKR
mmetsp:Transcript_36086/g.90056  ORF Transcript_36086/g.90056 Transcript_36086/m.90056 type:complete len:529 (-) Transcript_36086:839-2425(-)